MQDRPRAGEEPAARPRHRVGAAAELERLVRGMRGGGVVSPSVYDTAQVARFAPPPEGSGLALAWLLSAQAADGGWGSGALPRSRDISTLAAMLALATGRGGPRERDAVRRGERFLRTRPSRWEQVRKEELPIGGGYVLRRLLLDAAAAGLAVDADRYGPVVAQAEAKLAAITERAWAAGSVPLHFWEAWGTDAERAHQGPGGDIGTSPAATARWLACGVEEPEAVRARSYLRRAARATGTGVPGVVPTVYPIERTEQAFTLYALALAGDDLPQGLAAAAASHLADLAATYAARRGISHTDGFEIDADDTATAACALATFHRLVDPSTIRSFSRDEHFITFETELTPSVTTNAHCLQALALLGERHEPGLRFLLAQRTEDGLWERDRWYSSWCIVTAHAVAALCALDAHAELHEAAQAIGRRQRADGGFGSCAVETAYIALALGAIERSLGRDHGIGRAREAAVWYLERDSGGDAPALWTGKEPYSPRRLDRAWQLAGRI